ncbi:MAG: Mrr restriction system protein, partial [Caldilinea sp.]
YTDLMQPVMNALRAADGQASNADLNAAIVAALDLPPALVEQPHQPGANLTELEYRLQWTRTYLRQFGLIDSPRRGVWTLTDAGWKTHQIDRHEIVRFVRRRMTARHAQEEGQAPIFPDVIAEPETKAPASAMPGPRSPTPLFPTYTAVRQFLTLLDGVPTAAYQAMASAIWDQRGNPQAQVDWSNPDEWIPERLDGANRDLAQHLWRASQHTLNPRYTRGCWYFTAKHDLLRREAGDVLHITPRGRHFLDAPASALVAELDAYEGVLVVLHLVATQGTARRNTLLPGYSEYSRIHTTFQSDNVLKSSLYDRLRNLIERELVATRGNSYAITDAGLAYLEHYADLAPAQAQAASRNADLLRLARTLSEEARSRLHDYLLEMHAFKFEELIKLLLEEMGYDNVATTSPTNDKGVDVIGTIELGISAVREVIQAKRHKGTINRPVLDQLRGSLHRFNAVRGTIITTGRFSKGVEEAAFERGAAPITLIDGEKLLDLLVEYEIGVSKRQVEYFEFAAEKLVQFEGEGEVNSIATRTIVDSPIAPGQSS